jgi:drug/metabolite transporter (DMT)-like permease
VIISVLAVIFLKEKMTIIHIICLILTISGVILIIQPSFIKNIIVPSNGTKEIHSENNSDSHLISYIGIALGLLSAFSVSFVAILIKKLSDLNVHYSINIIFSSYIGFPSAIIISLIMFLANVRHVDKSDYDTPQKLSFQILYSISSAVCGCLNQLLVTWSNK